MKLWDGYPEAGLSLRVVGGAGTRRGAGGRQTHGLRLRFTLQARRRCHVKLSSFFCVYTKGCGIGCHPGIPDRNLFAFVSLSDWGLFDFVFLPPVPVDYRRLPCTFS